MPQSHCGNRSIESGEACDDGNLLDGDGCSPSCQVESGWVCSGEPSECTSLCGNGTLDEDEQCDGNILNGKDCTSVSGGFTGGTLTCGLYCTFDTNGCISAGCGNHVLDAGEGCDDGNTVAGDGCNANCHVEEGWECSGVPSTCTLLCGNGRLDPNEDCEGTLLGGQTCTSATVPGGYTGGSLACTSDCHFDTSGCTRCGNGLIETGEDCDGAALGGQTCTSATVPGGYTGGSLACAADCQLDTSGCTTCGNGVQETGEGCDDGNLTDGDGCSAGCQAEALPVLHWATGNPAVWGEMTITYALDAHAPSAPIVAAANADQRGYAYVFTATTYHRLSLPGHQWIAHGALNTAFPGVTGGELVVAFGVSWPNEPATTVVLATVNGQGAWAYYFDEDNSTGQISLRPDSPVLIDWSGDPNAPFDPTQVKAAFQTLGNANGWTHYDLPTLCQGVDPPPDPYPPAGTDVGAYLGIVSLSNQLGLYNASYCWLFYDQLPLAQFPPFAVGGAPQPSQVVAAFYSTAHGDRLYVVTQP